MAVKQKEDAVMKEETWGCYKPIDTDKPMVISFNNTAAREINELQFNQLLIVKVAIKNPDDNGFPQDKEFTILEGIEDTLDEFIQMKSIVNVGRVSTDGERYFYYYGIFEENNVDQFLKNLSEKFDSHIEYTLKEDTEKALYWNTLYPTKEEWQLISNQTVLRDIVEQGDELTVPRRIDHWICFNDQSHLYNFSLWAKSNGFEIEEITPEDEKEVEDEEEEQPYKFTLQIFHTTTPQSDFIDQITLTLCKKAKEYVGDYDGWETLVILNKRTSEKHSKDSFIYENHKQKEFDHN